ncbi:protein ANTAGONIST OF LIKE HETEROCHROMATIN PROTEIN 1-like [Bufo bufo]|uniref:protein ANTAGONIST OF LIKE HETEROCHROMATIN PROTEIN 1-like n=1 Tax=Bufo bufo TaxID=8384 RepID=UPI001ABEE82A|nr:protein ANTAGONIST OF LIKE HETEROCHROMATIN PROTEIN 1-like [Bufo bufo]
MADPGTSRGRQDRTVKVRLSEMRLLMKIIINVVRRRRWREEEARRRQRRRRYWVHPINRLRYERGHIGQLYSELRSFPQKFFDFVRMPINAFDRLLEILSEHLCRQDTIMRRSITPMERLLITLRFLATGESFASLHVQFRVGKSTISGIVRTTCHVIWQYLQPISMPSPTPEIWLQVTAGFQSVANFPNCIGAVDCKHLRVRQPPHSGSRHINYRKYFSVVLMAVADSTYKFVGIAVGAYGSTEDSRVLLKSELGRQVLQDQVTLLPPQPLPGTTDPAPFVMVSDEAFPLMTNLLRPYPRRRLDARKRVFNMRLSQARCFVEGTFGMLSSKWRVFTSAMQLDEATVDEVIKAACVLHNYVRDYDSTTMDMETQSAFGDQNVNWGLGRPSNRAMLVRKTFADYFMSPEGAVSGQFDSLRDGQPPQE